ncbi:5165_t:CDS:2, partial [Acaulospora colombiana]
ERKIDEEVMKATISFDQFYGEDTDLEEFMPFDHLLRVVDIIIICYDCSAPETLHNAIYKVSSDISKWHPIIMRFTGKAPICLVGCKWNNRRTSDDRLLVDRRHFVTKQQSQAAARQIEATGSFEWSEDNDHNAMALTRALFWNTAIRMSVPRHNDSRQGHQKPNIPLTVLIFGDMTLFSIPVQTHYVQLQLPIAASPIWPDGRPKLEHQSQQDHPPEHHNFLLPDEAMKEEGVEEEGIVGLNVGFMTYRRETHDLYIRVTLSQTLGDVIVICYDPSDPQTLHNAIYRWYPFVLHFMVSAPIFLVECHFKPQASLGGPQQEGAAVSRQEAENACRQTGAVGLIEWHEEEKSFEEMAEEALI